MNFAQHSYTRHLVIFKIRKLLNVLMRNVRLRELCCLSGDKRRRTWFVCYDVVQSTDVSNNKLFIFSR